MTLLYMLSPFYDFVHLVASSNMLFVVQPLHYFITGTSYIIIIIITVIMSSSLMYLYFSGGVDHPTFS